MTTTLTTRIEKEDKMEFDRFCKAIGLTPSSAINLFVKTTIREKAIPFPVQLDPFYSKENQERLKSSVKQIEKTGGTIHEVDLNE